MAVSSGALSFAVELFSGLEGVSARRMFGGAGLYHSGRMFALLDDDLIYLKATPALQEKLSGRGCDAFRWTRPRDGKQIEMAYLLLPDSALDDPDEAVELARAACRVDEPSPDGKRRRKGGVA